MLSRIEENSLKFWLLTELNRWTFAGILSVGFFGVLLTLGVVGPAPMRRVIEEADALWWVFSPMVTAIITAVALVVTVNQLVLSQELGALGDQHKRMQEATAFRDDVEPWLEDAVSPATPSAFLDALLDSVEDVATDVTRSIEGPATEEQITEAQITEAQITADQSPEGPTPEGQTTKGVAEIRTFCDELIDNARTVRMHLGDAQFGTFDVVSAAMDFDYSKSIYDANRLIAAHGDSDDAETAVALEDVVTVLEFYGPAREHVKTLYFQWELVNLSRAMLYASVPALLVTVSMLLYVDTAAVSGSTFGIDDLVWIVCAAVTVALAPFFLLVSHILRIASVAKRTLAMGPFILRDDE